MKVFSHSGGIAYTNSYLVADERTGKAVIFDAPNDTVAVLLDEAVTRGWDVIGLWLTHGHFDHLADHARVTERFPNAKVLIHRLDEPKLKDPTSSLFQLPFVIPPRSADGYVEDGQVLQLGSLEARVIFTPGHSPGHVMYHFAKEKLLIGGDLIIMNSIGRTDLPDSSHEQLMESIRRIMKLPPETTLLGGHGNPTTLEDERRHNDYVREALQLQTL